MERVQAKESSQTSFWKNTRRPSKVQKSQLKLIMISACVVFSNLSRTSELPTCHHIVG